MDQSTYGQEQAELQQRLSKLESKPMCMDRGSDAQPPSFVLPPGMSMHDYVKWVMNSEIKEMLQANNVFDHQPTTGQAQVTSNTTNADLDAKISGLEKQVADAVAQLGSKAKKPIAFEKLG